MFDKENYVPTDSCVDIILTVTVTYSPDLEILLRQLKSLPDECPKVVIDNGSGEDLQKTLPGLTKIIPRLIVVANDENIGLAAALNQGVMVGCERWPNIEYCLLLDQDSEPEAGSVHILLNAIKKLEQQNLKPGTVGPNLIDAKTGLQHGFHQASSWRWRRIYADTQNPIIIPSSTINGSGSLIPLKVYLDMGGLEESLFIDHIDTEWSFRLLSRGFSLWGVPKARILHRMGSQSIKYWLMGWRVWPYRSSSRHYFLFRNFFILTKRDYVPRVWKLWAVVKTILTVIVVIVAYKNKFQQLKEMMRGLNDGLKYK